MYKVTMRTENAYAIVFSEDYAQATRTMVYSAADLMDVMDGRFRLDNITDCSFPSAPNGPIRIRYELDDGERKYRVLVLVLADRFSGRTLPDLNLLGWIDAVGAYLPRGKRKLLSVEYFPPED